MATVKGAFPAPRIKKGDVVQVIVVRTKKEKLVDGSYIRFDENAAVLINDQQQPAARASSGPVGRELRDQAVCASFRSLGGALAMRIHKGDSVVVLQGKDRGKKAQVVRALPDRDKLILEGVNVAKRHAKPTRATQQGGVIDKFMPVHVSTVAVVCKACDKPSRTGYGSTTAKIRLQEVRSGPVRATSAPARPRLKERYLTEIRDQLKTELGLGNVMEVPRLEKIVINMGVGRATQQASLIEGAQRDLETITGQKPVVAKQSIAGYQRPRGPEHRRDSHPTRRPGLGVLRPAAQPGHSPHPRLPRPLTPLLRRQGQLHVRHHRATDLSGDRLRQDRFDQGHGRHDRDHRTHQRGRTGVRLSFRQENR